MRTRAKTSIITAIVINATMHAIVVMDVILVMVADVRQTVCNERIYITNSHYREMQLQM